MLEKIKIKDAILFWDEHFLSNNLADKYFEYFHTKINWQQTDIKIFGKVHQTPRKEAYFADKGKDYGYSGKKLEIQPWDKKVFELKSRIEKLTDHKFNACLMNLYKNGLHSNGWHADNEKELGENPIIASLSLGATRKFDLKHNQTKEKIRFQLNNGSLLIMDSGCQNHWKHQIPKEKKIEKPRINLTFRFILG